MQLGEWVTTGQGIRRRVVADGEALMLVEFEFAAGAVGVLHQHPHEQMSYVLRGRVRYTLGGETREMQAGEVITIPGGVEHGMTALEDAALLDAFSPPRQDFRG